MVGQHLTINKMLSFDSVKLSDFNGTIYITVFDKEIMANTLGQQSSTPMPYRKQKNILYKGTSTVKDG